MAYRKFSADKIFTGSALVQGAVLITTASGTIIDMVNSEDAGEDIEILEGMLCPGFVNAHCHTELSHMQGFVPENTGMVSFLMKVMFERQANAQQKQQAIERAIDAMRKSGIVAVGDICNTDDSAAAKQAASGQIFFHNFIETSGFTPAGALPRFQQAMAVRQIFNNYFAASQTSITPHAPYSVSAKLFELITGQSAAVVSIHNQESLAEDDFIRNKSGDLLQLYKAIGANIDFFEPQHTSSLQYILPLLPKDSDIILVHNCYTNAAEVGSLKLQNEKFGTQYNFCICANANLYIGNPLPDIQLLIKSGFPICMGTDSLASNHQLSVLAELQTLQQHFPFLTVEEMLTWATINGAKALQIQNHFGSFDKGKKPGVLLLKNMVGENLAEAIVERVI